MKSALLRPVLLVLFAAAMSFVAAAQPSEPVSAPAKGSIFVGEKLVFEAKVSKLKLNLAIAELTFTTTVKPDSNQLVINSVGVSKGTMLKLFRFSFLQEYDSLLDPATFNILKTNKHDVQKSRVRDSEAIFDYKEKLVSYVETDPKDLNRPPRRIASEIGAEMNDMISGLYAIRLRKLTVGTKFEIKVSDSGLVFRVPVVVKAREQQKSPAGKVWCMRVEPEIFGKDRLIERKGKMVIWMTDDALHTPVRAQVDTEYGKVDIKLKSMVKPS